MKFATPEDEEENDEVEELPTRTFTRIVQTKFSNEVIEIGVKSEEEAMGKCVH